MWDVLSWIFIACSAVILLCVVLILGIGVYAIIKTELEMQDEDNKGGDDNGDG